MIEAIAGRNRSVFELVGQGIDCILVTNLEPGDANFYALTGAEGLFIYSSVLVFPDGSARLLVHELEEQDARSSGLEYSTYVEGSGERQLSSLLRGKRTGVNGRLLPTWLYLHLQPIAAALVDISEVLDSMRARKTEDELENLRKASAIAASVAADIEYCVLREGMTESDLKADIEYSMTRLGSQKPAFPTVVAFGEASASPHHLTGNRRLKPGDLVLADFGATCGNMVSDLTRTYCFGHPQRWQRDLYQLVLQTQTEAITSLHPGVDGAEIHAKALSSIQAGLRDLGLQGGMPHGLGHAIGFFEHDGPRLNQAHFSVPEGLVTTVEPGAYVSGRGGIRIEDDVIVGATANEILTSRAPKAKLLCLGDVAHN